MSSEQPELSFVIPCYNEEDNLRPLVAAIREAVEPLKLPYEIVITDDCSKDKSWEILKELAAGDPRIRGAAVRVQLRRIGGALGGHEGRARPVHRHARRRFAERSEGPAEISGGAEAVRLCLRHARGSAAQGDNFVRIASSRIANWVRNKLSGENISDAGCCYRAFKRECIENLKFFKGMHRFLPTLFKIEGFTVTEIPVTHNPRLAGQSNYGVWNRLFASFYDLLAVRWMKKRMFRYQIAERVN